MGSLQETATRREEAFAKVTFPDVGRVALGLARLWSPDRDTILALRKESNRENPWTMIGPSYA